VLERWIGLGYLALAALGYLVTAGKSREKARAAARNAAQSFGNVAPTFLAVFGLVGLLNVFVPPSVVTRFLGEQGGIVSLLMGDVLGSLAAGPPVAAYPVAASLLKSGAWAPGVATFIVSWTLVGFISIPFEAGIFGIRFAVARNLISFLFAMIIGLLMGIVL
jgi:uncharacterized membrane protein YraQ (UPF0718 family)